MAYRLIKFGVKAGLVGGVIYYTVEEGVWKDSEHTTELYSKLYKNIAPYVKEVPVEIPEFPKTGEICFMAKNYWNKGVNTSFVFLSNLPEKTVEWSKHGYDYVVKQVQQSQQKDTSMPKNQEISKQ